MAKTKYVRHRANWTDYNAYRDPDDNGWEITFDGIHFWIGDDSVDELIIFLNVVKKASQKKEGK